MVRADSLRERYGRRGGMLLPLLCAFLTMLAGYLLSCMPTGPWCYLVSNDRIRANCSMGDQSFFVPPPFFGPKRDVVSGEFLPDPCWLALRYADRLLSCLGWLQ